MADDLVDQLNDLANSLERGQGKSTAYGAAAEIIRLRGEINQLQAKYAACRAQLLDWR